MPHQLYASQRTTKLSAECHVGAVGLAPQHKCSMKNLGTRHRFRVLSKAPEGERRRAAACLRAGLTTIETTVKPSRVVQPEMHPDGYSDLLIADVLQEAVRHRQHSRWARGKRVARGERQRSPDERQDAGPRLVRFSGE